MSKVLSEVISAEKSGRLWDREVLGYPVWPLERLNRFHRERFHDSGFRGSPLQLFPLSPHTKKQWKIFLTSVKDALSYLPQRHANRDLWVLSSSTYRRKDTSGVYQCAYAEHLRRQCGERLLFFERNVAGLAPQGRDDVVFIDSLLNPIQFGSLALGNTLAHLYPLDRQIADAFAPTSTAHIYRSAIYGQIMLAVARAWLRRVRPNAVFVLCGYNMFIPWQIALKEQGIPLIELQHGIIHESHPGYILDNTRGLNHLPDHIVVFGKHFGDLLQRESPYWKDRWSIGGHPWLKQKREELKGVSESRRNLIVMFTWVHPPVRERFVKLIPELRRKLNSRFRIVIKPHPQESDAPQFYHHLLGEGVELADPNEDTYKLLGYCRLAVNIASTVAIEALAYSCPSAVLTSDLWADDIRALVAQGILHQVDTADELIRLAHEEQNESDHAALANRLFGIEEPDLDFLELIHRLLAETNATSYPRRAALPLHRGAR